MLLLAIDTATDAVTVAVHDGSRVVAQADTPGATSHGELLAPSVRDVLRQAGVAAGDLSDVAVGVGPGPFTGLRVGLVTAEVLAWSVGARLHGVVSLDALAAQAAAGRPDGQLLVATDARRREVYWARYAVQAGEAHRVTDPAVSRPADLPEQLRALPTAGRGPQRHPGLFAVPVGPLDVSAAALAELAVARLAAGAVLDDVRPRYLRRPDVHVAAAAP